MQSGIGDSSAPGDPTDNTDSADGDAQLSADTSAPPTAHDTSDPSSTGASTETSTGPVFGDGTSAFAVPAEAAQAPTDAVTVTVRWVLDGDSFEIDGPEGRDEVRLIGLNAPEGTECLGDVARDVLIDEIAREEVQLVVDGRDEFGRLLGYVWHDDQFINVELISSGLVLARSAFGHAYQDLFDDAEVFAKEFKLGLWSPSACGDPASSGAADAVRIASVNFDALGRDNENPNGEWIDVENVSPEAVDIAGWRVRDESTRHRFVFPAGTVLEAGSTVRVRSGCAGDDAAIEPSGLTELFWCDPDGPVWSNGGDTAFLLAANGAIIDTSSWESIYE